MPEQEMQQFIDAKRYVVWVVPGAWWILDLDTDEILVPEVPPPWPAPCLN